MGLRSLPEAMPYAMVALLGLVFGSFLNVCIYRLPRGESIVSPGSHCPRCGQPIAWYDNIPILSYLLLRGRCRRCGARISPLYPLVEGLTGCLVTVAYARLGPTADFVKQAIFIMLLVILIFTDLTARRLPHPVTLLGTAAGIALSFLTPVNDQPVAGLLHRFGYFPPEPIASFLGAVTGGLVGAGLFYGVGEAAYRILHKEALGFGDVMLMLMVGTFLGLPLLLLTILLGSVLGTLIAAPLELVSPRFRHFHWPYGSFLGAAAIYAALGGGSLMDAYLRWAGLAR
jgi:leader peptidase (prepilin peptidase)/N-methyltransferase